MHDACSIYLLAHLLVHSLMLIVIYLFQYLIIYRDMFIISRAQLSVLRMCVCVITSCVQNISKNYERILMKFCGEVGHVPWRNRLDFAGDPHSFVDSG